MASYRLIVNASNGPKKLQPRTNQKINFFETFRFLKINCLKSRTQRAPGGGGTPASDKCGKYRIIDLSRLILGRIIDLSRLIRYFLRQIQFFTRYMENCLSI